MKHFYKYGEVILFSVIATFLPVIILFDNTNLPKDAIFYWAIPAFIFSTIGFFLYFKYIKAESIKKRADFAATLKRHNKAN